jgi:hypothetical protein
VILRKCVRNERAPLPRLAAATPRLPILLGSAGHPLPGEPEVNRVSVLLAAALLLGFALAPVLAEDAAAWGTYECGTLTNPYPACCPALVFWGSHGNTVCIPQVLP